MNTSSKIAELYGVTQEQINSSSRKENVCFARQMQWLILHHEFKCPLPKIGQMYNRDRTTVYSGIKRIQGLIQVDKKTKEIFQKIYNN